MHNLRSFWNDEAGSVVSAELVTIGAVVAVGAVTGLQTVSTAINDELHDVTLAIRNLDQSYSYRGMRGCNSMTAGSAFVDLSVGPKPEGQGPAQKPSTPKTTSDASPVPSFSDDEILLEAEAPLDENARVTAADEKL